MKSEGKTIITVTHGHVFYILEIYDLYSVESRTLVRRVRRNGEWKLRLLDTRASWTVYGECTLRRETLTVQSIWGAT